MPVGGMGVAQFRGTYLQVGCYVASATIPSTATLAVGFIGSIALPGAAVGDIVEVAPVAAQAAGVAFLATITAAGVAAITVVNGSAGTYNPGAQSFNFVVRRAKLA
jgi:hypothetical protein